MRAEGPSARDQSMKKAEMFVEEVIGPPGNREVQIPQVSVQPNNSSLGMISSEKVGQGESQRSDDGVMRVRRGCEETRVAEGRATEKHTTEDPEVARRSVLHTTSIHGLARTMGKRKTCHHKHTELAKAGRDPCENGQSSGTLEQRRFNDGPITDPRGMHPHGKDHTGVQIRSKLELMVTKAGRDNKSLAKADDADRGVRPAAPVERTAELQRQRRSIHEVDSTAKTSDLREIGENAS